MIFFFFFRIIRCGVVFFYLRDQLLLVLQQCFCYYRKKQISRVYESNRRKSSVAYTSDGNFLLVAYRFDFFFTPDDTFSARALKSLTFENGCKIIVDRIAFTVIGKINNVSKRFYHCQPAALLLFSGLRTICVWILRLFFFGHFGHVKLYWTVENLKISPRTLLSSVLNGRWIIML